MNRILKEFELHTSGRLKENTILSRRSPILEYQCKPSGRTKPGGFQPTVEHLLRVTFGVAFWSNQVQFEESRRSAERVLLHRLYGETIGMLKEAEKAIYDGEAEQALVIMAEIRKSLTSDGAV